MAKKIATLILILQTVALAPIVEAKLDSYQAVINQVAAVYGNITSIPVYEQHVCFSLHFQVDQVQATREVCIPSPHTTNIPYAFLVDVDPDSVGSPRPGSLTVKGPIHHWHRLFVMHGAAAAVDISLDPQHALPNYQNDQQQYSSANDTNFFNSSSSINSSLAPTTAVLRPAPPSSHASLLLSCCLGILLGAALITMTQRISTPNMDTTTLAHGPIEAPAAGGGVSSLGPASVIKTMVDACCSPVPWSAQAPATSPGGTVSAQATGARNRWARDKRGRLMRGSTSHKSHDDNDDGNAETEE